MKKSYIVMVILIFIIISSIAFTFNKDKKDIIKIDELSFESFDLGKVLASVEGNDVDKSKYWIGNFTMLLSKDKTIRSMNITVFKKTVFGDRKLIMHLNEREQKLIVWDKLIRGAEKNKVRKSNYFTLDEFVQLISVIKKPIINDLQNKDSSYLHVIPRSFLDIDKTQNGYLVDIVDKKIIDVKEMVDGKKIKVIKSNNEIKGYRINGLKTISVFSLPDGHKIYCLDEVEGGF
ncbi:hypothetical protein TR13x_04055 [Caloranaerobacter sp. TR13]|uniref:hypothetical protein n=1 Tax=Caloranaerobacter sp. TR13 TaxID=1302151 RepID=UPI0006D3D294|nr:hypothetical protein [Caloranaerobacter sp. TR13]KPU27702.1 hypothetical protein TR13x_04055 [Caloranaerobacter sp. TR13]